MQAVEAVRVGGEDVAYTIAQHTAEGFEVALPRMDQQRTSEQVEVDFRAEVFAYNTRFAGRIRDSTRPFEVAQPVTPKATNSLQVALLSLDEPLIGRLTPHPAVFTPNGDGRNDAVRIEYDLLYIVDAIQVELAVFDLAGREVAVIYTEPATSGRFAVEWDGHTPSGRLVPPGSYLVRLTAETDRRPTATPEPRLRRLLTRFDDGQDLVGGNVAQNLNRPRGPAPPRAGRRARPVPSQSAAADRCATNSFPHFAPRHADSARRH